MNTIHIQISEIKINPRRREPYPEDVRELAESISSLGLLNPVTLDREHTLIAGLHRLEAVKLLGWTEIKCTVSSLEGLQAELAEIDENFIRTDLSGIEYGELLLRRKEIYETLHPETRNGGDRKSEKIRIAKCESDSAKSFTQDTAEKLGVHPATIARQIQTAKNLTTDAKKIIRDADTKITKKDALTLSRLPPEQQKEAANLLAAKEIRSMSEYHPPGTEPAEPEKPLPEAPAPPTVPYTLGGNRFASFEESVADLKNHDKDCTYTPDIFLAELDSFIREFHKEFNWYSDPFCSVAYPAISPIQFSYLQQRLETISDAVQNLLNQIERAVTQ